MSKIIQCFFAVLFIFQVAALPTEKISGQAYHEEKPKEKIQAAQAGPPVRGFTAGRAKSLAGAGVALLSVTLGGIAIQRAKKQTGNSGRNGAMVALVLGVAGIILSIIHLITSAGAVFGSGSGKAGALVALALGIGGACLGGRALTLGARLRNRA